MEALFDRAIRDDHGTAGQRETSKLLLATYATPIEASAELIMFLNRSLFRRCAASAAVVSSLAVFSVSATATIVTIQYYDRATVNANYAGGPLWTGYVDTFSNTLTIETWKELPLHGLNYWMPRNLPAIPLVWPARNASGDLYDVPDTFDGRINNDFAFISNESLQQMEWKKPIFGPNPDPNGFPPTIMTGTEDVIFDPGVPGEIWPGWGGYARDVFHTGDGFVKTFYTAKHIASQPVFDEHIMPALPVQLDGASHPHALHSTNAEVTAVSVPLEPHTIPEAKQWLAILAAASIALAYRWFARHRRTFAASNVS